MSIRQFIFVPAIFLVLATRYFGTCIPSVMGENVSLVAAAIIGAIAAGIEYTRPANSADPEWGSRDKFGTLRGMSYLSGIRAILRVVIAPVFSYFIFSQSLPWLYNTQFGSYGSEVKVVSEFSRRNGTSCPQFDGVIFVYSLVLCRSTQSLEIGTPVTLSGRSSIWGVNVEGISAVDGPNLD